MCAREIAPPNFLQSRSKPQSPGEFTCENEFRNTTMADEQREHANISSASRTNSQ